MAGNGAQPSEGQEADAATGKPLNDNSSSNGYVNRVQQPCHPHPPPGVLRQAYVLMRRRFGHQGWWPGETPFEICVGAVLTQNTNWGNVERAIARLNAAGVLSAPAMHALPIPQLAELIRPAGYFNVKARRLHAFLDTLMQEYGGELKKLLGGPRPTARARLLTIHGIGPETADSMLLYAARQHSFVVDAYTRRIFARHGWCHGGVTYQELQALCEVSVGQPTGQSRLDYWRDYHAQLVNVGKHFCRPRNPRCGECPLKPFLPPGDTPRGE